MGIQHSTATDAALARMRAAYVDRYKLRDFRLSGRSLMRLVRSRCADKPLVDEIRTRFTHHNGCDIQMDSRTWDHLEMFGYEGALVSLVAHPYHVTDVGREDMALLHRAGLNVIEGGTDESWYGLSTTQIRVEHPWLAGRMLPPPKAPVKGTATVPLNPAPSPGRLPGESPYDARLRRAAPRLLELARERAAELAAAIRLVPCVGPNGVGACLACEMRTDYDRIMRLIAEVELGDTLDSDRPPLFDA
jgi:hypothetical protein